MPAVPATRRGVADSTPGSRDAEEYLSVMRVPVEQLKALLLGGQMLTPSLTTCVLALARLEREGKLSEDGVVAAWLLYRARAGLSSRCTSVCRERRGYKTPMFC